MTYLLLIRAADHYITWFIPSIRSFVPFVFPDAVEGNARMWNNI